MANVLAVVELSRSIRNGEGIKVKQPLKEMVISVAGAVENYKQYNDIIQDELNIKACIWTHDFYLMKQLIINSTLKQQVQHLVHMYTK